MPNPHDISPGFLIRETHQILTEITMPIMPHNLAGLTQFHKNDNLGGRSTQVVSSLFLLFVLLGVSDSEVQVNPLPSLVGIQHAGRVRGRNDVGNARGVAAVFFR